MDSGSRGFADLAGDARGTYDRRAAGADRDARASSRRRSVRRADTVPPIARFSRANRGARPLHAAQASSAVLFRSRSPRMASPARPWAAAALAARADAFASDSASARLAHLVELFRVGSSATDKNAGRRGVSL